MSYLSSVTSRLQLLSAAGLALVCSGCAFGPQLRDIDVSDQSVELKTVPFFSQEDYEGGPAALATLIATQGVKITPADLPQKDYVVGRKEPRPVEVVAASRTRGLVPYMLQSSHIDLDIVREVQAGHPVMILQDLGNWFGPQWHFAVVTGVDPVHNTIIMHSGSNEHLTMSYGEFAAWRSGTDWAMVVVKPNDIPATADPRSWIAAAAPLEKVGKIDSADRAYKAATERWPDSYLAWEALANSRHSQRDLQGSSLALLTVLKLAPHEAYARNNLAQVLLERNCAVQAEEQVTQALDSETDPVRVAIYQQTLNEIHHYSGPSVVCPGV